MLRSLRGTA